MRISTRLHGGPASARDARRFVNGALAQGTFEHVDDVVVLLTSEVVTNAILHARSEIHLALELVPGKIRIEVSDASRQPPVRRRAAEDATSGRGLELVEALASDWGTELVPGDGKRVWFEVAA
ncbi:MAG: ATP-binding protein [Actinomycetota bacterium]|nr:ATP-binding protein [Actinomycetota bacterium]